MQRMMVVALLLTLVLCASCAAVGPEDDARGIPGDEVPYDLLHEERTEATSAVSDGTAVAIYLVRGDRLVEVRREVASEPGPSDVLRLLADGPTESEASAGLASAVPDPQVFAEVEVVRGTAEVDLDPSFSDLDGESQALAIAQAVLTLTARPGIGRVGFLLDQASVEVPRGDGTLTDEPLARDDFPELLSPS